MRWEHSSGAVLYSVLDGEIRYVLVEERGGHVGFPKGHIEPGETNRETALREIFEETGIRAALVFDGVSYTIEYPLSRNTRKDVTYFIASFPPDQTPFQNDAEIKSVLFLPFGEAMECLTHRKAREILTAADRMIRENAEQ